MDIRRIGWAVGCSLALASLQSVADDTPQAPAGGSGTAVSAAPAATGTAAPASSAASGDSSKSTHFLSLGPPPKSKRLKFRGPNGTCACDCAAGGISEADIEKAAAAKSASR